MREKRFKAMIFGMFAILLCLSAFAGRAIAEKNGTGADPENKSGTFNLDEIVVTGTKTAHSLKDVPVHTEVVNEADIENSGAQTVSDVLRSVSGIFAVSEDVPGVTSWRSKIRGLDFNSGYGLILVDGQRVKGGGMGEYGYGVNQVPLSLIEKIEVIKGPGSVLYGSDALAGVVNIITKPCPEDAVYGMELAAGSGDTKTGTVYAGSRQGSLGAYVNASFRQSGVGAYGYRSSRDEEFSENRLDTTLCWEPGGKVNSRLRLSFEDQDRTRQYKTKDVQRHEWSRKYRIAPEIEFVLDDVSSATVSGYFYQWEFNEMESGTDSSGFTPTTGDMFYRDAEARYTRLFENLFQLTLGTEFLQEELDYNMAEETVDTGSVYAQLESDVFQRLTVVLGARADDHSEYGSHFSPKISLMYAPFAETRIRASAGKGFKSPTIRQLYYTDLYQHGDYWYRSNPELEAEVSWGYSVGLEQELGRRLLFDFGLYRNDIDDKILRVETGEYEAGLPIVSYANTSEAYTQGVEAGIRAVIAKGLTGDLSYTYTDTEDKASGRELTYIPENNLAGRLVYEYIPWGVTSSINFQYAGEMYTNAANTEETDAYWLVGVKIAKDFKDHYTVSLEGNNIFDSDYGQPDREWLGATYLVRCKMEL